MPETEKYGGFKMRKILALLALVALCITCMASCDLLGITPDAGNEECEHTFSETWTSNATQHWHAATCEHGEIRDQLADHTDADENGLCDVCEYEIGHEHTFAATWTADDEKHWKAATCTHTDVKGYENLHSDNNTDGVCDVCAGHVHILDGAGFCTGCDKEVKPIDETDFGSVVSATTARAFKIKSGKVEYVVITRSVTEAGEDEEYSEFRAWDNIEYVLGTNGVYKKITEDEAGGTGNHSVTEQWVTLFEGENGTGVQAISSFNPKTHESAYVSAMPAAFGEGDLIGYFFAVPGLANAHGVEAFLYELYSMALAIETEEISFSYNVYVVNASYIPEDDSTVYNVNYFEVEGNFSYTDDYVVTSMEVSVDTYTNDPGRGDFVNYDADIDLTYDPNTGAMTLLSTAVPHTYYFKVSQEVGEREELALKSEDDFKPDNFNLYADEEGSTLITELEAKLGNRDLEFYILSEGGFAEFIYNDIVVTVTDEDGNVTHDLDAQRIGGAIQLYTHRAGKFNVTVSALGISHTVSVTITDNVITGQYSFTINVTESYGWSNMHEFVAPERGKYVFYFPGTIGLMIDPNGTPIYDPQGVTMGDLEPYAHEVNLREGQTFTFYFTATARGEYTVYYDIV